MESWNRVEIRLTFMDSENVFKADRRGVSLTTPIQCEEWCAEYVLAP